MNRTLYVVADVETEDVLTIGSENAGSFSFEAAEARAQFIAKRDARRVAVFAFTGSNEPERVSATF